MCAVSTYNWVAFRSVGRAIKSSKYAAALVATSSVAFYDQWLRAIPGRAVNRVGDVHMWMNCFILGKKEEWATDIQIGMDGKGRWIDNA